MARTPDKRRRDVDMIESVKPRPTAPPKRRTTEARETETERLRREATEAMVAAGDAYDAYLDALVVQNPPVLMADPASVAAAKEYKRLATIANDLAVNAGLGLRNAVVRAERLKARTVADRVILAPVLAAGLTGGARVRWIETGMSSTEQLAEDKSTTELATRTLPVVRRRGSEGVEARRTRLRDAAVAVAQPEAKAERRAAKASRTGKAPRAEVTGTTPSVLAAELGVPPRVLRAFLRSLDLGSGRGARIGLDDAQVKAVKAAWKKAHG